MLDWIIVTYDRLAPADVIALGAAVVALCALFSTIWEAKQAREHNRLSVRPILSLERRRIVSAAGVEMIFILENCGVGPALMKDRYFTVNGERVESDSAHALLDSIVGDRFNFFLKHSGLPGTEAPIPAGREQVLAHIVFPGASSTTADHYLESIKHIGLRIKYESLYGEEQTLDEV